MLAFNLVILAAITLQGGQGGGLGGGGFGGGYGGSYVGMQLPLEEKRFEHILTPGDKTDWPFEVNEGDVYIFRAESEIFDPAIEVTDADGKQLGENDDEAPGKQNARLLVYFDKPGKYSAHVKNYHSTSGGRYTLFVRKYRTQMLPLDTDVKAAEPGSIEMFSLRLQKGDVACFDKAALINIIIDPSGFPIYGEAIESGYANNFIRAEKSGVFMVSGSFGPNRSVAGGVIRAHKVRKMDASSSTGTLVNELEGGAADAWRIHVRVGEFIDVSRDPKSRFEFFFQDPDKLISSVDDGSGNTYRQQRGQVEASYLKVGTFGKRPSQKRYFFKKEGDYVLYVRSMAEKKEPYNVKLAAAWTVWDKNKELRSQLEIGETVYYKFVGQEDEILKFTIASRGFDVSASLYNEKFEQVSSADDISESFTECSLTLNVSKTAPYYLAVRCNGDGGSGEYSVKTETGHAQVIKYGETIQRKLLKPEDGTWKVTVPGPEKFAVVVSGDDDLFVSLNDSDGKPVQSTSFNLRANDRYLIVSEGVLKKPYSVRIHVFGRKPGIQMKLSVLSAAELAKRLGGNP